MCRFTGDGGSGGLLSLVVGCIAAGCWMLEVRRSSKSCFHDSKKFKKARRRGESGPEYQPNNPMPV